MADTKKTIDCPACGKEMNKIYVPDADLHIDICLEGCGGIFFDNRELEKFDEKHENASDIFYALEGRTFKKVYGDELRICPVCHKPMVKMGAGKGGVQIDVCNICGAKFLDNGELQRIRNDKENNLEVFEEEMDALFKENYRSATLGLSPKKASPRRKFFSDLVSKYLWK